MWIGEGMDAGAGRAKTRRGASVITVLGFSAALLLAGCSTGPARSSYTETRNTDGTTTRSATVGVTHTLE
jgi:hypothetical protein